MILAVWRLERRETLATNNTNITPSFNLQREREREDRGLQQENTYLIRSNY